MKTKTTLLIAMLTLIAGCTTTNKSLKNSPTPKVAQSAVKTVPKEEPLKLAIRAYRISCDKWPKSVNDLKEKTEYGIDYDNYTNLQFDEISDLELTVTYGENESERSVLLKHNPGKVSKKAEGIYKAPDYMIRIRKSSDGRYALVMSTNTYTKSIRTKI